MKNMMVLDEMWHGRELGDPFLLRHDGRYYLYSSSFGEGIKCWTSEDMASFAYYGMVCMDARITGAYAPEVSYNAGWFYMVTSPVGSGHYLLRSREALGPFEVISENIGLLIDGSLFVDDDGKSYFLRAGHTGIQLHDMPGPDQIDVHGQVLPATYMDHWTEGPMIVKRDDRYFLTYTGNHVISRGYRVDYCVTRENPKAGWHQLRHRTLLLETEDPFYALGHSSTCLAPDMDSLYIVYHNNEFNAKGHPLGRRLNLDRLFFNGDRMYVNASYWEQAAPRAPLFTCRGGEGLLQKDALYTLPVDAPEVFTVEWNGILHGAATFAFAGHTFALNAGGWMLNGSGGACPPNIDWSRLLCVRLSQDMQGTLRVWVNGMQLVKREAERLPVRQLSVAGLGSLGFVALSDVAGGSGDTQAHQNVPGMLDAIHSPDAARYPAADTEAGCRGVCLKPGDTLTFPVNARDDGLYHLALRVMNDGVLTWQAAGSFALQAGAGTFTVIAPQDMLLDRIQLVFATPVQPCAVVAEGQLVPDAPLRIIGHKFEKSLLHKYSGFTCAENHGQGYVGAVGWQDYAVHAVLHLDPQSANGQASIFLRVRGESWFHAQVEDARQGYRVRVLPDRVELAKNDYDEQVLCTARIAPKDMRLQLRCEASGNHIAVYQGDILLLHYADPDAYLYGKAGMECRGEGVGFVSFDVCT